MNTFCLKVYNYSKGQNKKSVSFYLRYPKMKSPKMNRAGKQEVDNLQTRIQYVTCRTPSKSTIPRLKWLWCMVTEKSVTENIGYGLKDG